MDQKQEASPSIKVDPDMMMEDSLDGGPPSVGSGDMPTPMSNMITPISSRKKQLSKKVVTGYILYSGDVRRTVAAKHPESSFGDISRIVGNEWRNLPAQEKQSWEEKAAKVNEESALKMADPDQYPSPSIAIAIPVGPPVENQVFECCWDNCDFQFEDIIDCYDHAAQEPHGHVFMHFANIPSNEAEYQCQWRGCGRVKKGAQPFPHVQRLSRHIKEVHILKGNGRVILPQDRSRNYVSSRTTPPTPTSAPNEAPDLRAPTGQWRQMHCVCVWPLDLLVKKKAIGYCKRKNNWEKVRILTSPEVETSEDADCSVEGIAEMLGGQ
uniref:HMG box domain-containing protein n=1 Tax=Timema tahoe TaxID=61484 RepID=A0A7R9FHY7_9NEOP|nr:unnamed protein product [Timema tahoe]